MHNAIKHTQDSNEYNPWLMIGKPFRDGAFEYTVTFNRETKVIAVNPINTANAGALNQMRTSFAEFERTGLPAKVKSVIRAYMRRALPQ